MHFDRNEIHIQAFVAFIDGRLISARSSSSTFNDFKISAYYKIKNKNEGSHTKEKHDNNNLEVWYTGLPENLRFSDSQI